MNRLLGNPFAALAISAALHLAAVLVLALGVCPWFERLAPESRGTVDVDVLVVGERSKGGGPPATGRSAADRAFAKRPQGLPVLTSPTNVQAPAETVTIDSAPGEGGGPRVLSVAEYLKWVRDHNEAPLYPRISRIRGEQGRAVVRVVVGQAGSPLESVEVEQSSGFETLDRVALETARSWSFPPFRGTNGRLSIAIPFKFSLD